MAKSKHGFFTTLVVLYQPVKVSESYFLPTRVFLNREQVLVESLVFRRPDDSQYIIPKGTLSDGPSFPLLLSPFLPARSRVMEAGFYHDHLCRSCYDLAWCDSEFMLSLKALKINPFYAYLCYLSLRIASPWRKQGSSKYSWMNVVKWIAKFLVWSLK